MKLEESKQLMINHMLFVPFGTLMCAKCNIQKDTLLTNPPSYGIEGSDFEERFLFWNSTEKNNSKNEPEESDLREPEKGHCDFSIPLKEHDKLFPSTFKGEEKFKVLDRKELIMEHTE